VRSDDLGRTRALLLVPLLALFLWLFVGVSLSLCLAEAQKEDYTLAQVLRVTGIGLITATVVTVLLAMLAWLLFPNRVLRRVGARPPRDEERKSLDRAWGTLRPASPPAVRFVDGDSTTCFAVGGRQPSIVISSALFAQLDEGERVGVLAHEWGHLRNRDALVNVLAGGLSKVLVLDPVLALLVPAIQRAREYAADSHGARAGAAADLASALVKIATGPADARGAASGIVGPDRGWFAPYPPLEARVRRLLDVSEGPSAAKLGPAGAAGGFSRRP
jgi:Zn-dependent protease with chaperone function